MKVRDVKKENQKLFRGNLSTRKGEVSFFTFLQIYIYTVEEKQKYHITFLREKRKYHITSRSSKLSRERLLGTFVILIEESFYLLARKGK